MDLAGVRLGVGKIVFGRAKQGRGGKCLGNLDKFPVFYADADLLKVTAFFPDKFHRHSVQHLVADDDAVKFVGKRVEMDDFSCDFGRKTV
jgi:hypothetical protein